MVANGIKLNANPLGMPIGSQMWPHQALIGNSYEGLRDGLQGPEGDRRGDHRDDLAERRVLEPDRRQAVRKMLDDRGLKCPSAHFRGVRTPGNLPTLIEWAQRPSA